MKNYRPVCLLNSFSRLYEHFLDEQFPPFVNRSISELLSTYRKEYSTNHCVKSNYLSVFSPNAGKYGPEKLRI